MPSLKRREGYLLIDNSSGPGVSEDQLAKLPHKQTLVPVPEGKKFEAALLTCHHCHIQMIRNPARVRERAYCRKCDHYICDKCAAVAWQTGECRPLRAVLDDLQEQTLLREQAGLPPGEILIK
jgi:hypothetical protein